MNFVTKPCQSCGSIMVNVNPQTRFCEDCKRIKGNAAARAAYHKNRERILKQRRERRIAKNAEKPKKIVVPKEIKRIKPIEQWSKDHPVKTRQSEFLKQFPNADLTRLLPCHIEKDKRPMRCAKYAYLSASYRCYRCRDDYWNEEV